MRETHSAEKKSAESGPGLSHLSDCTSQATLVALDVNHWCQPPLGRAQPDSEEQAGASKQAEGADDRSAAETAAEDEEAQQSEAEVARAGKDWLGAHVQQKLKDGKIQAAASKKDDMMVVGGGGKGKKGKKPKNQQKTETNQSETFSIDFYQIKKFGAVLLSPPTAPEDLDPTIEELKKKQKAYIEAGDAELKKETSDLEKRIEYEVE